MTNENTTTRKANATHVSHLSDYTSLKTALIQLACAIAITIAIVVVGVLWYNNNQANSMELATNEAYQAPTPSITEKPVYITEYVVDEEKVNSLANELFATYVNNYTAKVDQEATERAIQEQLEVFKAEYVAEANAEETVMLAEQKAQQLMEEYKAAFVAEQEATRVATVSTIRVFIIFKDIPNNNFYLTLSGSLYDRLTYDMIYAALEETGWLETYRVYSIANKDHPEVFIGEDYTSVRTITLKLR